MTAQSLQRSADLVSEVGPARIAEMTGIKRGKVNRFPNAPMSVTIRELNLINAALRELGKDV